MIEFVQWLVAIEIIGLAALPLTLWVFRSLPDRGYTFAKVVGLVAITYVTWLIGSVVSVVGSVVLPLLVLVALAVLGWRFLWFPTLEAIRTLRTIIVVEEVLFVTALIVWSLMRAYMFHPGIDHTEQYMDMSLLGASMHSASFPPYDPWMSGHTINYYYMGYLLFGLLIKLSGVAPAIGYNLSISFIFAFVVAGSFSLGYALTRRITWAALAPVFVALVGNWHGILVQVPAGHNPASTYYWFWDSTRVIGSNTTITEFPFFSFMLGDLHPHVMALPVVLLVLAFGFQIMMNPDRLNLRLHAASILPWGLLAVAVGMLFTLNSWDFPTYLLVAAACIAAHAYVTDNGHYWWIRPGVLIASLGAGSLVLYAPFFLHFQSLTHGVGTVSTPSDLTEFLQVFGVLLLPVAALLGSLVLLFQPAGDVSASVSPLDATEHRTAEAGAFAAERAVRVAAYGVLCLIAIVGAHFHLWVMLLMLALGVAACYVLHRVLNGEELTTADAVALICVAVACLVIALPEVLYVRDTFDGGSNYRMNTVFKFYFQGWVLLGAAGAYCVYRAWRVLSDYFSSRYAWAVGAVVAVGTLGGLYYTVSAPQSVNQGGLAQSLDGSSVLQASAPGDYAAVQWLKGNVHGTPVELEATGGEYDAKFARISTFTGLPTVMGWAGHEYQWRGADPDIATRVNDIKTFYSTNDIAVARTILRRYGVRYVIVGPTEQQTYPGPGLAKFSHFMRPVFSTSGTTIYAA